MIPRGAGALDQITSLTSSLNQVVSEFDQARGAQNLATSLAGVGDARLGRALLSLGFDVRGFVGTHVPIRREHHSDRVGPNRRRPPAMPTRRTP